MNFDYNKQPGLTLLKQDKLKNEEQPTISIITPFYSGHEYLEQTVNCVLNQTKRKKNDMFDISFLRYQRMPPPPPPDEKPPPPDIDDQPPPPLLRTCCSDRE